jgi:hypothetical protein
MDLATLFEQHGRTALRSLAEKTDSSEEYLWQCATFNPKTGKPRRRPGTKLCERLVAADPQLTLAKLRPDIYKPHKE